MKNKSFSGQYTQQFLFGFLFLLAPAIPCLAGPGGGAATGTGTTSTGVNGGATAAPASGGSAHVSASSGSGGASAGRTGVGSAGLSGSHNVSTARIISPGFTANAAHAISRGNRVNNYAAGLQPIDGSGVPVVRSSVPSISRRFNGTGQTIPPRDNQADGRTGSPTVVFQPTNAWTDPRGSRLAPATRAGHYGYDQADGSGRQSSLQNRFVPGQTLYPGAYGYSARTNAESYAQQRRQRTDRPVRRFHRYNPYYYTGLYYPYFYGGYFPGYYGSFGDGLAADSGLTGTSNSAVANDSSGSSNGGYWEQQNAVPESRPSADDQTLPPDQPANVGPENPLVNEQRPPAEAGPDSLVEAVQSELAKRGYFAGKVDSVYGDSTREALRRFQTDRKLAVTGRVNEATLHALQLD